MSNSPVKPVPKAETIVEPIVTEDKKIEISVDEYIDIKNALQELKELKAKADAVPDASEEELKAIKAAKEQKAKDDAADLAYANEKVQIQLFKDGNRYKDPLYVSVNEKRYMVPRGVRVTVERFIAMAIQESQAQDADTATLITYFSDQAAKADEHLR
jgi:hypothetical protein